MHIVGIFEGKGTNAAATAAALNDGATHPDFPFVLLSYTTIERKQHQAEHHKEFSTFPWRTWLQKRREKTRTAGLTRSTILVFGSSAACQCMLKGKKGLLDDRSRTTTQLWSAVHYLETNIDKSCESVQFLLEEAVLDQEMQTLWDIAFNATVITADNPGHSRRSRMFTTSTPADMLPGFLTTKREPLRKIMPAHLTMHWDTDTVLHLEQLHRFMPILREWEDGRSYPNYLHHQLFWPANYSQGDAERILRHFDFKLNSFRNCTNIWISKFLAEVKRWADHCPANPVRMMPMETVCEVLGETPNFFQDPEEDFNNNKAFHFDQATQQPPWL